MSTTFNVNEVEERPVPAWKGSSSWDAKPFTLSASLPEEGLRTCMGYAIVETTGCKEGG